MNFSGPYYCYACPLKQCCSVVKWLAYLLPDPAAPGLIPSIPKIFSEKNIAQVGEVNQWCWLEESGQWLENVDRTHQVAS